MQYLKKKMKCPKMGQGYLKYFYTFYLCEIVRDKVKSPLKSFIFPDRSGGKSLSFLLSFSSEEKIGMIS
ncbi:MAG: hypothetical protein D6805_02710 [Planctomycetota bacterium]|nr:MAG: hypothetical protein D6805_02710 [Planctomycetota bacterium]